MLCRSCEKVCPVLVPYGQLLDRFRTKAGKNKLAVGIRLKNGIIRRILHSKKKIKLLNKLLVGYQRSVVAFRLKKITAKWTREPARIDAMLPVIKPFPEAKTFYPALTREIGKVGLFTGCMGELIDQETINAAIGILTKLGYGVIIPKEQVCCGALDLHAGDLFNARKLSQKNIQAFNRNHLVGIVSIASGCGAMLKEYAIYNESLRGGLEFVSKIQDISQFIVNSPGFEKLSFNELEARIYLHVPCSLKNVMREELGPSRLLKKIPGVSLIPQPRTINCCGAAGSYMIEHPETARSIRDDLILSIKNSQPDYLVTSNIGCAMHMRAGLCENSMDIEVLHPVVLAERLLI